MSLFLWLLLNKVFNGCLVTMVRRRQMAALCDVTHMKLPDFLLRKIEGFDLSVSSACSLIKQLQIEHLLSVCAYSKRKKSNRFD